MVWWFSVCFALTPRAALDPGPVTVLPLPPDVPDARYRLTVKLRDGLRGRADHGMLRSEAGVDLDALARVAARHGVRFEPLLKLAPERLLDLERRAAEHSGKAQPDLQGLWEVVADDPRDGALLARIAGELDATGLVEFVDVRALGAAPPGDIGTPTPDYSARQTWLDPNPGLNVGAAWAQGLTGAGVRVSDVEYGWVYGHEDLVDRPMNPEPGQTVPYWVATLGYDQHGTAAFGEMAAPHNGYGCDGSVPGALLATYPEWSDQQGSRRPTAIANALADSAAGDVIMLEMQDYGPDFRYVMAEIDPAVWTVVRAASDAGVIVVAAAGNGNANLDSASYANYRAMGDSGAIIVGAGSANTSHDKLSFSTYGARVDVQGWGERVFTLGYGDFATIDGMNTQKYTSIFNGTSSATPTVATAVTLLQGHVRASGAPPLSSQQLRDLLNLTGQPQGSGGHIGALPDVGAALAEIDGDADGAISTAWGGFDGDDADPAVTLSLTLSGSCTTTIDASLRGATPGGRVEVVVGPPGVVIVPPGPCGGTPLQVGPGARRVTTLTADVQGSLDVSVPGQACGSVAVVVDHATCGTTVGVPLP
ncbi:MAG: S8 family serine peptidase [Alphaproteobacteria bacterium]|nr:S8 family serine peptidase [Alphaproteobacteria bacterium]MCB9695678.1 S8 family serine peptidase [Alphaproteobacteria bacterium]